MKRFEARLFRILGGNLGRGARFWAAAVLLLSGAFALVGARSTLIQGPSDFAGQAISILSNGAVTSAFAPRLVGLIELALAVCLLAFPMARLSLALALVRLVLAIAPLVQLQDALWAHFPTRLNGSGQSELLAVALFWGVFLICCRERWAFLREKSEIQALLRETALQAAVRRRQWRRFAIVATPIALVVLALLPIVLPRYLAWFHARQEAAAFADLVAGKLIKKSMPGSAILPPEHGQPRKITTWVYLPPGYGEPGKRFPTIYVMHGMPGEVRDTFVKGQIHETAARLIKAGTIEPVILVGWDGQGPGGPDDVTNFLDRSDYPMESFIVKELVPYIDRTYKTIPDARFRALDGISAGGYAAPLFLFKYPDIWRVASSHNGFYSPEDQSSDMQNILGPKGPKWDENNPIKLAQKASVAQGLHLYLDIGSGDDLVPEFGKFVNVLKARGIDHEAHIFPGRHTWGYWSQHFNDSLLFADKRFKEARASNESLPEGAPTPAPTSTLTP